VVIQYLETKLYHKRFSPKAHDFKYNIFYLMIDLDTLQNVNNYSCLSYNRFNIWSLFSKDYGNDNDGLNLKRFKDLRQEYNIPNGKIYLITIPKFLGHSFNPVSFFFFYNEDQKLCAVLAEVHNTFKERHCYLLKHSDNRAIINTDIMEADKVFHVSPFFPVSGHYAFHFADYDDHLKIKINYFNEKQEKMLATGLHASKKILRKYKPFSLAIRYPFISLVILFRIHYHAAHLWFKKIRFFRKPTPPSQSISS